MTKETPETDNTLYWLWIQQALGVGAPLTRIAEFYDSPYELYSEDDRTRSLSGVFTSSMLERLRRTPLSSAENILESCRKKGYTVLTPEHPLYPQECLELPDMPAALYAKGDLSCLLDTFPFAIVGTRKPEKTSVQAAVYLSSVLSRCGMLITSGGAVGIDRAAHVGALNSGHRTICVLGSALDSSYLQENAALRSVIAEHGLLLTEKAPGSSYLPGDFPKRNRILAALVHGVLVIEAAVKSGSLSTARRAADLGREIFAVPGDCISAQTRGSDYLIRDGAGKVTCAQHVLDAYLDPIQSEEQRNYYISHLHTEGVPEAERRLPVSDPPALRRVSTRLDPRFF